MSLSFYFFPDFSLSQPFSLLLPVRDLLKLNRLDGAPDTKLLSKACGGEVQSKHQRHLSLNCSKYLLQMKFYPSCVGEKMRPNWPLSVEGEVRQFQYRTVYRAEDLWASRDGLRLPGESAQLLGSAFSGFRLSWELSSPSFYD